MSNVQLIVVTPEETAVDVQVSFVALPLYDGELGVGSNHAPMIGRLGCGELRFQADNQTQRYYVDGGFVQVADNVVSIMTNRAIEAAELNVDDERAALKDAREATAHSPETLELRDKRVTQARARLRLANR